MLIVAWGCQRDEFDPENNVSSPLDTTYSVPPGTQGAVTLQDVENKEIIPSTLQYYENLAAVIEWYAQHPEKRSQQDYSYSDISKAASHNPVIEQAEQIKVQDSAGNFVTIFDLPKRHRKAFFKSWVKIQAHFMSEKLKLDDTPERLMGLLPRMRNRAFKRAFPTPASLANTTEDPYKKVSKELTAQEDRMREAEVRYYGKEGKTPPPRSTSPDLAAKPGEAQAYVASLGFWANLYYVLPVKFDGLKRGSNPKYFVSNLKKHLRRGRILIALPGGYDTYNVLHTDFHSYIDVGHAAVISKNSWEVSVSSVKNSYSITTGIPGDEAPVLSKEPLEGWMKHGKSFVGAVVNGYWKIKWSWFWFVPYPEFFWIKSDEVDGRPILAKSQSYSGREYCYFWEVLFSKWPAPSRFICSTLPWYAAKKTTGKNLGDWWKASIFPAGLYLSDYVRIVGSVSPPPVVRTTTSTSSYRSRYWTGYEEADTKTKEMRGDGQEW